MSWATCYCMMKREGIRKLGLASQSQWVLQTWASPWAGASLRRHVWKARKGRDSILVQVVHVTILTLPPLWPVLPPPSPSLPALPVLSCTARSSNGPQSAPLFWMAYPCWRPALCNAVVGLQHSSYCYDITTILIGLGYRCYDTEPSSAKAHTEKCVITWKLWQIECIWYFGC